MANNWTRRLLVLTGQLGLGIAMLLLWQLVSTSHTYGFWVGSPIRIVRQLAQWVANGEVYPHLLSTLQVLVYGYFSGVILGIFLGLIIGLARGQGRIWDPIIKGINSIPRFALAPLLIVWFGTGALPKVVLVTTDVGYIVLATFLDGVRRVDNELMNALKIMGATKWQVITKVILPSALTSVLLGARLSIPNGLMVAVAAEMLVGSRGMGYLLSRASGYLDINQLFAGIVIIMGLGLILNLLLNLLNRQNPAWTSNTSGKTTIW